VREGYRALLEKQEGPKVVGEAGYAAAYQCYKQTLPEVVIMDISMPGRGGIDAIEHIREFDANARVLVFTIHTGAAYALHAFRAGAKGYVTKSSPPDLLVRAVRDIAEGRLNFPHDHRGKIDRRIASALNLSRKTVANYHYVIKSKLGVDSDIKLLYLALRQGLVEPVSPGADAGK
jgi:DNA-binding NarL/FixJ family response regulator